MDSMVCRVCFAHNVRMHCIADIGLQEIYQIMACTVVNPEDDSPKTLCYMCCSQLQRCYKFSVAAQMAEGILTKVASRIKIEERTPYKNLTNVKIMDQLSVAPVKFLSMDDPIESLVLVKEENAEENKTSLTSANLSEMPIKIEKADQDDHITNASGIKHTECHDSPSLEAHTDLSNGDYSCHLCEKAYSNMLSLKKHMRVHKNNKNSNAYSCNMYDPDGRPYSCNSCKKKFKTLTKFNIHSRIHTGDRPFACSQCTKTFNQNSALNTHMRIHNGDKPHACDRCGKTFCRRDNLRTHMRFHSGERPFTCNECDKTFYQSGALKIHMRIHTGDRPYSCSLCGKTFSQNVNLQAHMITHSMEKPHICQLCSKAFRRKKDLKVHMVSHTGDKSFACKLCGKTFIQNYHLQRHMKIHTK